MAGRRSKPARVQELAGNPGKRALNKERVCKITGVLRPPAHLGRFGKSLWKSYAGKLVDLQVLTEIDWPAWEALCLAYDRTSDDILDCYGWTLPPRQSRGGS